MRREQQYHKYHFLHLAAYFNFSNSSILLATFGCLSSFLLLSATLTFHFCGFSVPNKKTIFSLLISKAILFLVYKIDKSRQERTFKKKRRDAKKSQPLTRWQRAILSDPENCNWVNILFTELWPYMSLSIAETTRETLKVLLEESLNQKKPTAVVKGCIFLGIHGNKGIDHNIRDKFWKYSTYNKKCECCKTTISRLCIYKLNCWGC